MIRCQFIYLLFLYETLPESNVSGGAVFWPMLARRLLKDAGTCLFDCSGSAETVTNHAKLTANSVGARDALNFA